MPERCPPELKVDATEAVLARSGTKRYHCSPIEVELPTIRVDLGRVHVRLPTIRLHAELALPGPGNAGATELPDVTGQTPFDFAGSGWRVEESSTEAEITIDPPRVTVTPTRVHALRESRSRRRLTLETRWDSTRIATTVSPIAARISGCIHND